VCAAAPAARRALLRHAELAHLGIAHVDCDAFYATIEKRDDPTLAPEPVIVGGRRRGVVAAACNVARTFGVRSAMPMFEALRLCPHARVVRPDMDKYSRVGREVRQLMLALTPLVEPLSIDEAFLDLSGTERLHGLAPAKVLARFAAAVEGALGITVSIGLSCNKFLAKIASDLDKPRGFAVLGASEAQAFLAERPVSFIFGVGKVSAARLARDGFHRFADLQRVSEVTLMRRYARKAAASPASRAASTRARSALTAKPRASLPRQRLSATSQTSVRSSESSGVRRRRCRRGSRRRRSPA
jgi:DNA polymerase-4